METVKPSKLLNIILLQNINLVLSLKRDVVIKIVHTLSDMNIGQTNNVKFSP